MSCLSCLLGIRSVLVLLALPPPPPPHTCASGPWHSITLGRAGPEARPSRGLSAPRLPWAARNVTDTPLALTGLSSTFSQLLLLVWEYGCLCMLVMWFVSLSRARALDSTLSDADLGRRSCPLCEPCGRDLCDLSLAHVCRRVPRWAGSIACASVSCVFASPVGGSPLCEPCGRDVCDLCLKQTWIATGARPPPSKRHPSRAALLKPSKRRPQRHPRKHLAPPLRSVHIAWPRSKIY